MGSYLCSPTSAPLLRARLGPEISIQTLPYGEKLRIGEATVSFHPAGHIPGSAQVRLDVGGEVWLVTGDYKTEPDATSEPFELVRCHGLVTETTFGLPIYRWRKEDHLMSEIAAWWRENRAAGKTSVLLAYSLGKAQRLIKGVGREGPVVVHGAVATMNRACQHAGLRLPPWYLVSELPEGVKISDCLVIAPPSAAGTSWMNRMGKVSTAFASGWMALRGARRRRGLDHGFVVSDHVDWPNLLQVVRESGAETVWTTHGYAETVSKYVRENMGLDSQALVTHFVGETLDESEAGEEPETLETRGAREEQQ